jgi:hypothetical protein
MKTPVSYRGFSFKKLVEGERRLEARDRLELAAIPYQARRAGPRRLEPEEDPYQEQQGGPRRQELEASPYQEQQEVQRHQEPEASPYQEQQEGLHRQVQPASPYQEQQEGLHRPEHLEVLRQAAAVQNQGEDRQAMHLGRAWHLAQGLNQLPELQLVPVLPQPFSL